MFKKNVGRKEVRRRKNVASITSWWTSVLAAEKKMIKETTERHRMYTSFATQNSARSKDYLDINIYIYTHIYYTVTHWTQQHNHNHHYHDPCTSIFIYIHIYIHLYYINVYITSTSTKETPHSLWYDYYTDVHAIGICETPVCVSRTITCFSLFANNTLIITPLLVVSRICTNNSFATVTNWCVARSRFRSHICGGAIFHPLIIALA